MFSAGFIINNDPIFEFVFEIRYRSIYENIKSIYRKLWDNHEYNLRYESVGQDFKRKNEIDRKYSEKTWGQKEPTPDITGLENFLPAIRKKQ